MSIRRIFVSFICLLCSILSFAADIQNPFLLTANYKTDRHIDLIWKIAPGYHLYRDYFYFKSIDPSNLKITPDFPVAKKVHDSILGAYSVYSQDIVVPLYVENAPARYQLLVRYQGCKDQSSCYPPEQKYLDVNVKNKTVIVLSSLKKQSNFILSSGVNEKRYDDLLKKQFLWALIIFFLTGVLLALTPCVLPMIPVLSAILVGTDQKHSRYKAFKLSLVYVLAMAFTYALVGALFSLFGHHFQMVLQAPWVLILSALVFVWLAGSLFGWYELQLPLWLRSYCAFPKSGSSAGTYFGAAVMGAFSLLVLSPCVTPPLIGALLYIMNTGEILYGALALFCLGLGMGVPLLALGFLGGKLLPKAGHWMNLIKVLFGLVLLAMAVWLVARLLSPIAVMWAWGLYFLSMGVFLYFYSMHTERLNQVKKVMATFLSAYGILLMIVSFLGHNNPWQPFLRPVPDAWSRYGIQVLKVSDLSELQNALNRARLSREGVLIDFYASWCMACQEMDAMIQQNSDILNALRTVLVIKVDITHENSSTLSLKKSFGVYAPPVFIFYNKSGLQLSESTLTGAVSSADFLARVKLINERVGKE